VAAYGDAFTLLGVLLVVAIPLVLLLGGPARPAAKREVVRHLRGR
jgi:hypothetical protein